MSTQHTPGPWRLCRDSMHFDTLTTVEGGAVGAKKPFGVQMIVQVGGDSNIIEAEANARLIAAAPRLLELLIELVDMEGPQPGTSAWGNKARATIAKATGGAA